MKLSFQQKRIGAGILLVMSLLSVGNLYFEWGFLGPFGKEVMVGIFVVLFIYLVRVGPTLQEVQDYREKKDRAESETRGFRSWMYLLTLSIVMFVVMLGPLIRLAKREPVQEDWIELIVIEALVVVAGIIGWRRTRTSQDRKTDRE
jgi:hypothetical protein